jgi:hypothetical protein
MKAIEFGVLGVTILSRVLDLELGLTIISTALNRELGP